MFKFNSIYHPITAEPFNNNETYIEIQPCEELKQYIRCFWLMVKSNSRAEILGSKKTSLIIPDTCMDIIFNIDMERNKLEDVFCGINDSSFISQNTSTATFCFGIRFYFWAVPLFSDEDMNKVLNAFVSTEVYFKNFRHDFENILIHNPLMSDRIIKTEQYLFKKLNINKQNNNVMNAVYKLLKSKGTASITELSQFTMVSQRQLERLFLEHVGISPKKLSGLIRYQYLWQDILSHSNINAQDAVCKYGYTDQAHLLKDFKKYHSMTPNEAKKLAYSTR